MISILSALMFLIPLVLLFLIVAFAVKSYFADKDSEEQKLYHNYIKDCVKILIIFVFIVTVLMVLLNLMLGDNVIEGLFSGPGIMLFVLMLFIIFILPIIVLVNLISSFALFLTTRKSNSEKAKKYKKFAIVLLVSLVVSIAISYGLLCYIAYSIMSTM